MRGGHCACGPAVGGPTGVGRAAAKRQELVACRANAWIGEGYGGVAGLASSRHAEWRLSPSRKGGSVMFGRKKRQPVGERIDLAGRALNVLERTQAALADGRMVVPGKARPSFEKELAELHSQLSAAGDEATPTVESVLPAQWLAVRWDAVWCKNTEVAGWYPYFRGGLSGPPVEYVSVQGDDLWRLSPWSEPILLWVMETEGVEHDVEIPPDVVADVRRSLRPLLRPRDPLLGFEAVREARARVLGPKHVAGRNPAM